MNNTGLNIVMYKVLFDIETPLVLNTGEMAKSQSAFQITSGCC